MRGTQKAEIASGLCYVLGRLRLYHNSLLPEGFPTFSSVISVGSGVILLNIVFQSQGLLKILRRNCDQPIDVKIALQYFRFEAPCDMHCFLPPEERVTLRLAPRRKKKVSWQGDTIDNEHLNKKSSKSEYGKRLSQLMFMSSYSLRQQSSTVLDYSGLSPKELRAEHLHPPLLDLACWLRPVKIKNIHEIRLSHHKPFLMIIFIEKFIQQPGVNSADSLRILARTTLQL